MNNFKPHQRLIEAIKRDDLVEVYSYFTMIAYRDPSFITGEFENTLEYVKENGISSLVKQHDGEVFKEQSHWDEEYWGIIAGSLVDNFSFKRIEHLKDVGRYLYGSQTSNHEDKDEERRRDEKKLDPATLIMGAAAVAAIVVVGTIILIASKK